MYAKHTDMEFIKEISYQDWKMIVQEDGTVIVTKDDETRTYDIPEDVRDVVEEDNYVFIYVDDVEIKFYQFKFEVDDFLVGDTFDQDDEFLNTFACHVFGEEV